MVMIRSSLFQYILIKGLDLSTTVEMTRKVKFNSMSAFRLERKQNGEISTI